MTSSTQAGYTQVGHAGVNHSQAGLVRGKKIRLSWTDGPTQGTSHDHEFHFNGTVEWQTSDKHESNGSANAVHGTEKPKYADERVSDGIRLISYLSRSGYTLTVVLNFNTGQTVGIASNERTWMPVHGHFEVID